MAIISEINLFHMTLNIYVHSSVLASAKFNGKLILNDIHCLNENKMADDGNVR